MDERTESIAQSILAGFMASGGYAALEVTGTDPLTELERDITKTVATTIAEVAKIVARRWREMG